MDNCFAVDAHLHRAKIVDISPKTLTVEVTGADKKVQALVDMLKPFGIREIARTGTVALKREYSGKSPDWSAGEKRQFV